MKRIICSLLGIVPLLLASCGTTSSMKDAQGTTISTSTRKFSKATVLNFQSSVAGTDGKVAAAQIYFADCIASETKKTGGFKSVTRGAKPDADTLVIDGTITRYAEGSAALRLMIGLGAGSSYFNAKVNFKDSQGKALGEVLVDKNSWVLGGALAATQTPQTYMEGAAKKIATEARKLAK